jgi:RHS repeat-associated protein
LGVKNLAILAQIDTQKLQISDTLRIFEERVGAKNYELSNHLGNVLATISDKTIFNYGYYSSIVYSAQLYYPFGWEIPTLSYTAKKYRFGFNGVEKAREIGEGVNTTFYREQDTRAGRWWSFDPRPNAAVSPYAMMENNPIAFSDVLGDTIKLDYADKNTKDRISYLKNNVPLFNAVYEKIDAHTNTYSVISETTTSDEGGYRGKVASYLGSINGNVYGGKIFFKTDFTDETIFEEFFHAYQDIYYGTPINNPEISLNGLGERYIHEWEAEAKMARGFMMLQLKMQTGDVKYMIAAYSEVQRTKNDFVSSIYGPDGPTASLGQYTAKYFLFTSKAQGLIQTPYIGKMQKSNYYDYLEAFSIYAPEVYSGEQRQLMPDAYNSLIKN